MPDSDTAVRIDLIYDGDDPNIERARRVFRTVLEREGTAATWLEWDRNNPSTPVDLQEYGSPTVLVNGKDVCCDESEDTRSRANASRVYVDDDGTVSGAPSARLIARAIREAREA